jgi:hypothetical protein
MSINNLIQFRRGTTSQWNNASGLLGHGILYNGELGFDTTTKRFKIGDGSTHWASGLSYAAIVPTGFLANSGVGLILGTDGSTLTIGVTGIYSTQINDFNTAVDARITNAAVSEEQIHDILGSGDHITTGFLLNGSGLAWSYDDANNTLSIGVTGIPTSLINNFNSHTHVWSNITDASTKATLAELTYLSGVAAGTATANRAVVLDSSKNIVGINSLTTDGNVTVGGDLNVLGTTTTVNSTTVNIGDNIIQVNVSGAETLGGLQVLDHDNSLAHQIVWDINDSRWEFISNSGSTPNVYTSGNISANTLTSTVSNGTAPLTVTSSTLVNNLNADLLDGQHGSYYRNFINLSGIPSPIITGTLTGDVTGTSSVTLTDLSNGVLTINTTIANNSVALGTDTTGQYASTVTVTGTGLLCTTPDADDGTAYTITSNATHANATGTIVARDSTGNFYANTIYATFNGNGSSITNLNASNINAGTIGVAYLPTNIPVINLVSSGITLGSTIINLGQTSTVIDGLTRISGVSANSPTYVYYAIIDGGSP